MLRRHERRETGRRSAILAATALLVGLRYEPLYESREWDGVDALALRRTAARRRSTAARTRRRAASSPPTFVATDDGTGIVHIAPAFGEDDYALGRAEGLLFLQPVGLRRHASSAAPWRGQFVKEADPRSSARPARARPAAAATSTIRHTYPFCWRCDTPLLYYAKPTLVHPHDGA